VTSENGFIAIVDLVGRSMTDVITRMPVVRAAIVSDPMQGLTVGYSPRNRYGDSDSAMEASDDLKGRVAHCCTRFLLRLPLPLFPHRLGTERQFLLISTRDRGAFQLPLESVCGDKYFLKKQVVPLPALSTQRTVCCRPT